MKKLLFLLIFIQTFTLWGQIKKIGTPTIINYPKSVYDAGTQNWGICQDNNDFIYFANNEGVVIFNGTDWQTIEISQSKPVRSIFKDAKNNIYARLLNDFGKLVLSENGLYEYKSMRSILPPEIEDFDDVWKIHETTDDKMIFQSYEYIFIIDETNVEIIKPENKGFI